MESISSKAVKILLRIMKFKQNYATREIDLQKIRKDDVATPTRWMCRGSNIKQSINGEVKTWYIVPKKKTTKTILFYFHGGGFIGGMIKQQWSTIAKLAVQSGSEVIIPEYPLAPESNYKDAISAVSSTYESVLKKVENKDVIFIGDSAGGGLMFSYTMLLKEKGRPLPARLIALSPWVDVTLTNPDAEKLDKVDPMIAIPGLKTAGEMYAGGDDTKHFLISPLYGNMKGLPPVYIFAGTHDILFPDEKLFAEKAKKAGVETYYYEYKNMVHGWMFLPVREAKKALKEILSIIGKNK